MADLVTRLRLDNKQFDENIRRSKQELDTFKAIGSSVTGSIKNLGMQFAAAAGLMEAFDTAINSNSITQNRWNDNIGAAKESVDSFFTSLATGNWSVFENGIINAVKLSKKYSKALRELKASLEIGDVKISFEEKELNRFENRMNNKNLSKSERDKAANDFKELGDQSIKDMEIQSSFAQDKMNELLEGKGVKADGKVRDMIFRYLDPTSEGYKLVEKYEDIQKEISIVSNQMMQPANQDSKMQERLKKQLDDANKAKNKIAEIDPNIANAYNFKANFGEQEEYEKLLDTIDKIVGYQDRIESVRKQVYDGLNDYKGGDSGAKVNITPIIPTDSLADIEKQISDKKNELRLAVNDSDKKRIYKELAALENKERVIKFRYEHSDSKGSEFIKPRKGSLASMANIPSMKLPSSNDKKLKKSASAAEDYASALTNCATAIATFNGQKLEDNGEGWTQWSSNLLAAAASTIIGLQSLTMAKGVNSAFDLPFPANIAAAAMVLSTVISLFSSIPAFANGGIFESPLTSGDRNLARLNGGEMILNKGQQYNLFKLLDGGSIGNGTNGNVQFKISGKDLVGVLGNYNNKVSKVR